MASFGEVHIVQSPVVKLSCHLVQTVAQDNLSGSWSASRTGRSKLHEIDPGKSEWDPWSFLCRSQIFFWFRCGPRIRVRWRQQAIRRSSSLLLLNRLGVVHVSCTHDLEIHPRWGRRESHIRCICSKDDDTRDWKNLRSHIA